MEAYGKDTESNLRNYHQNWFGRLTGATAGGLDYWVRALEKRGLKVVSNTADDLTDTEKITLLKTVIITNAPIMISIGNGYLPSGTFDPLLQKIVAHWITLWGYDNRRNSFYVYDSGLLPQVYDKSVSVGNTTRTYTILTVFCNFFKRKMLLNQSRRVYTNCKFNYKKYTRRFYVTGDLVYFYSLVCVSIFILIVTGNKWNKIPLRLIEL